MKRILATAALGFALTVPYDVSHARTLIPPGSSATFRWPSIQSSVASPPLLSPQDLLAAAQVAQQERGTAHITASITVVIPETEIMVQKSHGDVSFRENRSHTFDTVRHTSLTQPPRAQTVTHRESIYVPSLMAQRMGRGAWRCTDVQGLDSQYAQLAQALEANSNTSMHFAHPASRLVRGILTWHIHVTIALAGLTPSGHPIQQDIDVAQADHTLVRSALSSWMEIPMFNGSRAVRRMMREHEIQNYSRYGAPIAVTSPQACVFQTAHMGVPRVSPYGLARSLLGTLALSGYPVASGPAAP